MNKKSARRRFLEKCILGASAIGAVTLVSEKIDDTNEDKPLRLISADGQLYEIDPIHAMKMCQGKISNARLKAWVDEEAAKKNS